MISDVGLRIAGCGLRNALLAGVLGLATACAADEGEGFRAVCAQKGAEAEGAGAMAVAGRDGWLFLAAELRHIGAGKFWGEDAAKASRATDPANADPLPAILDFKRQIEEAGVELIFVPVPPKAIVYPDGIDEKVALGADGKPPRLDSWHRDFYGRLREDGVDVLDLTEDFLAARAAGGPALYCRQDTHWSGQACVVAAQKIAAEVKARPWLKELLKKALASETKDTEITGDLWSSLNQPDLAKEVLPLRFVRGEDGAPPADDRSSPIVLLGDSHNLVFHGGGDMLAAGAGLADQLALELGTSIDVLGVRGSGATPSRVNFYRRVKADPDYLAGKKLVIWCLSAREFTESSGWKKVPVK
jgi:hypothetical protein